MIIKIATSLQYTEDFSVDANDIRSILNYLKHVKGSEYVHAITQGQFKYVLMDSTEKLEPIGLMPEVIFSTFEGYDTLYIIHEVCGEGTAILVAVGAAASAAAVSASIALSAIALIINVVISIAISFIINLLAPTPEFSSDPAQAQANNKQSSLFNGAPLIREQGGIVPIIFGNPFCGGVLISSGVSTEDVI